MVILLKVLILNGSPKGENSITYQTCLYIENLYSSHTYVVEHIGKNIRKYEKDMSDVINKLEKADLIIFAYPVYTFIAPYQVHRFIELLKDSNVNISGKFVTQITTSKHFYDVTAHKFIEENCLDLGLKVIPGLSADMEDLLLEKGQKEAEMFFKGVLFSIENDISSIKKPIVQTVLKEYSGKYLGDISKVIEKDLSKRVVLVTSIDEKTSKSLINMIDDFMVLFPYQVDIVSLNDIGMRGGCISCFNCAVNGNCIYKDNFQEVLRKRIQTADAIIYAFTIKNHYTDSIFKMYDDRQFCNGHRTVVKGTPIGYLIDGEYSKEFNLQMILEGRAEVGGTYLSGIATSEYEVTNEIEDLVKNLVFAIDNKLERPANFYGVGGMKIFRDLIYEMQGLMKEDHRYYKKTGVYDFPQNKRGKIFGMKLVGSIMSVPIVKKKMGNNLTKYMLEPYKKVIKRSI